MGRLGMNERRYEGHQGWRAVMALLTVIAVAAGIGGAAAGSRSQPAASTSDMWSSDWAKQNWWELDPLAPMQRKRAARHQHFMDHGVSGEYRGLRNPYSTSPDVVRSGRLLYAAHCRDCHGSVGMGDGDKGLALNPSPALLAFMIQTPMAADEYLIWSISEGGVLFGTGMPAFKDRLSAAQIWKIIAYMRAGFPRD